jgi:nucleotide sugar dehydrogenase
MACNFVKLQRSSRVASQRIHDEILHEYGNLGIALPPVARRTVSVVVSPLTTTVSDRDILVGERRKYLCAAIVGLGYVGLPTALSLFESGAGIVGYDNSDRRIAAIRNQDVDLLPHDRQALFEALQHPRFDLTNDVRRLEDAEAIIICVPTPVDEHLVPDLSLLRCACDAVTQVATRGQTIILTSTTYVGTTQDFLVRPLESRGFNVGTDIHVAFSPERIDPGIEHSTNGGVPRVVGGWTPQCGVKAAEYLMMSTSHVHIVPSPAVAEMTKLFENVFRATNIALVNELADHCNELDLDVRDVIDAAATKPYGFMRFTPGPGVGGHCIPCDPHYLLWQMRSRRAPSPVVESVMSAIAARPRHVVHRVLEELEQREIAIPRSRVLVHGVAYKPNVDDVRESPALEIIAGLESKVGEVAYYDPRVPAVTVDGRQLHSLDSPDGGWDLVLLHTLHDSAPFTWFDEQSLVLDATYRLTPSDSVVSL